ncbi:MAG: zincin-like metallopeptidase domain-containing protein [Ilumatobacteraceae bacterium]
MNAADVMAATVADLVAAIEAGAGEWRMPWTHDGTHGVPRNTVTGQTYRGGNVLALWAVSALQGWGHEWATFKQWQKIGATVRKGERGTHCIYWNVKPVETTTDVDPDTGDEITLTTGPRVRWARAFVVFNAAQVDGHTSTAPVQAEPEPGEVADWFARIPAHVVWGGGNPCFIPSQDRVLMPAAAAFTTEAARWGTLAHELGHWTGHPDRLARVYGKRFGDDAYAAEELVAELSAAFTCATLGIPTQSREDHAPYVAHWCRVLKADPSILWSIASKAQAATDHLASNQPAEAEVAA